MVTFEETIDARTSAAQLYTYIAGINQSLWRDVLCYTYLITLENKVLNFAELAGSVAISHH